MLDGLIDVGLDGRVVQGVRGVRTHVLAPVPLGQVMEMPAYSHSHDIVHALQPLYGLPVGPRPVDEQLDQHGPVPHEYVVHQPRSVRPDLHTHGDIHSYRRRFEYTPTLTHCDVRSHTHILHPHSP